MKISVIHQLIKSINIVLAYDFDHLFKKTELKFGSEKTNDAVYIRKPNFDLDLIKECFSIEDDDKLQKFLYNLKSAISDFALSQSDIISIKEILGITEKKASYFLKYLKNITSAITPSLDDITYSFGSAIDGFTIEEGDEEKIDSVEALNNIENPEETKIAIYNTEVVEALTKDTYFKEIELKSVDVEINIKVNAIDKVILENLEISGDKGSSNAKILIGSPSIDINGGVIGAESPIYNVFEGLLSTNENYQGFEKIEIINLECLNPQLLHNVLSFYTPKDNAQIIIKNCKFSLNPENSNVLRLSNCLNAKNVQIIFEDVDWTYEEASATDFDWAGLFIYQAYNDKAVQGDVSDLETWVIKVNNCKYNGQIITDNNPGQHNQVVYAYNIGGDGKVINELNELPFKVLFNQ